VQADGTQADGACFLCEPDEGLVYARSESFFALLGWGPIGEGYSLVATREHVPSMLDVSRAEADELQAFTGRVRGLLRPHFGESLVTEHGRVATCVEPATSTYEPHCLHAHRLLFPGIEPIDISTLAYRFEWKSYYEFKEVRELFNWPRQYLYVEHPDETCQVAPASAPVPRQFFRTLIAAVSGTPEVADWRSQPRLELVEAAREKLQGAE
jgi:hypothetical protein